MTVHGYIIKKKAINIRAKKVCNQKLYGIQVKHWELLPLEEKGMVFSLCI